MTSTFLDGQCSLETSGEEELCDMNIKFIRILEYRLQPL